MTGFVSIGEALRSACGGADEMEPGEEKESPFGTGYSRVAEAGRTVRGGSSPRLSASFSATRLLGAHIRDVIRW